MGARGRDTCGWRPPTQEALWPPSEAEEAAHCELFDTEAALLGVLPAASVVSLSCVLGERGVGSRHTHTHTLTANTPVGEIIELDRTRSRDPFYICLHHFFLLDEQLADLYRE